MSQPAVQHHQAGAGPAAMLQPRYQAGAGPLLPRHQVGAGPAAMPPPRSSRAPLFTGTVGDSIQDFVVEYEEYADSCGLTDRQKTETIIRYLSREIRDFWKSHNNYLTGNWRELKRELLTFYNGSSGRKRYSEEKLREFARRTSKLRMRNEDEVNHYYWQFMLLSKPLLDSHRLTTEAHNKIFWRGFHKKDRAAMTPRLIARHPDLDGDEYFDYQDVNRIARRTFSQTRGSDSDDSADESRSARGKRSDRGYDQEEHDSRETDSTRRDRSRQRRSPPIDYSPHDSHSRLADGRHSPPIEAETKIVHFKESTREEEGREIDDLMRRMRGLSIHDETYAMLYGRCAAWFPTVAQGLPKPQIVDHGATSLTAFTVQTPPSLPLPPTPTQQSWPAPAIPLPTPLPPSNPSSFFRSSVRSDSCAFCLQTNHRIRGCPVAKEYVRLGRALIVEDRLSLPNGQQIPNDGTGRGIKHSIDTWLAAQAPIVPATVQQVSFVHETPPHFPTSHTPRAPSARIEEITESHIVEVVDSEEDPGLDEENPFDFFQVFATEKKKRETRRSKLPELQPPIPQSANATPSAPTPATLPAPAVSPPTAVPAVPSVSIPTAPSDSTASQPAKTAPQYRYQSTAEDLHLVSELESWLMEGKLAQTTPAHILAASPTIRKDLVEKLRLRRVEATTYEEAADDSAVVAANLCAEPSSGREPAYSLPLREIDVEIGGKVIEAGVIDPGSQIVVMREDLAREAGVAINASRLLQMEGANGATNWTLGCAEYLPMRIGDLSFAVHAHVVERAPFRLLLGRPFQHALLCRIEDLPSGDVEVSVQDPEDPSQRVTIPSRPRKLRVASVHILTLSCQSPIPSQSQSQFQSRSLSQYQSWSHSRSPLVSMSPSSSEFPSLSLAESCPHPHPPGDAISAHAYKKVAQKVRPVPASLPEDFRILRRIPSDPLLTLPTLPSNPPDFTPGLRLTQDRLDAMGLNQDGFLLPEELKLLQHVLRLNEAGLAWTEAEKGRFRDDYFTPVKIPVIEHIPWAHRNLPIPPGILGDVIQIFKDKFAAGVYEHSDASYRSRWFCVKKKNGALRLVHDLQPLNAVTIRNSGVTPFSDQLVESMAGRSCYSMLDLFVGYDHRTLDVSSRDLTTVQSPIGALRLTCLPMGWTNASAIFHEDVTFILEPEIPHVAWPYVDDCSIKGPATRFETGDGGYETLPDNPGIRKFIWLHLLDVHRILHRLCHAGATVSAKKIFVAVPEVIILGHKCTYAGRVPDDSKISRIRDWPTCKSLTDVRAFLGTAGFMRIWIKNYATLAHPLVNLTRKGQPFVWTEEHDHAMQALKDAIIHSPALISIDYTSGLSVYVGIDSSIRGVGWILCQDCADGKRRPARFGSISWNEREARYSQPKIELYGLFRALRALRVHLIGILNLVVEMDAQYIRGMLRNPDIQPNATINRWIAAVLLFDFKLVHIPADKHHGPDGLSRREPAKGEEEEEEDDPEDWIDEALSLGVWVSSLLGTPQFLQVLSLSQALSGDDPVPGDPAEFPVSEKALKAEDDLARVKQYLHSLWLPTDLDEKLLAKFLRLAARFFILNGRLWRRQAHGRHQLFIPSPQRLHLVRQAHDQLGHKGFYSTRRTILDRFWWPSIEQDIKWYTTTCHQCQLRQTAKVRIPPTVAIPAPLFRKVYIDTMFMPPAAGFRYIVQARCSLSAWPEWRALRTETGQTLGAFIFEEILCRWGAVEEIVTDNGTAYVAALDWLATKYGIRHIRISPYNSQANGIVERQHRTIRESLVKLCAGNTSKWPTLAPLAFWADRATTRKSTGYSPFYMAHGIEPILPFDLILATFLVPDLCHPLTTAELLATCARQLQKQQANLDDIQDRILKSRLASVQQFTKQYQNTIKDHDFGPGSLVLVRSAGADAELTNKTKPRYFGPMVVIRRTRNGAYRLAELDGALSKLRYAAFRLFPYFARSRTSIPVTRILDRGDLAAVVDEVASPSDGAPDDGDDA